MAEVQHDESGKKKGKKHGAKKLSTHIDMTPMVDLACLLITFFMLTTAFAKPKVMEIALPDKDTNNKSKDQVEIAKSRTFNILITGDDKVYYYIGKIDMKKNEIPTIIKTDYSASGLRKALLDKNKSLFEAIEGLRDSVNTGKRLKDVEDKSKKTDSLRALERGLKRSKVHNTSPIVLIKADDKAKYKNIVDVIDEMAICNIASYSLIPIEADEINLLKNAR